MIRPGYSARRKVACPLQEEVFSRIVAENGGDKRVYNGRAAMRGLFLRPFGDDEFLLHPVWDNEDAGSSR